MTTNTTVIIIFLDEYSQSTVILTCRFKCKKENIVNEHNAIIFIHMNTGKSKKSITKILIVWK